MKSNLKRDMIAGFNVFLLALPLCLGISFASKFPPIAGIISSIIGGLLASWWGGAKLTIKGPAAGLIVIAIGAVTELGYERTLAVGVVAALIQIIIGSTKKAIVAELMSPSIIHGMLAAIGIIIVSQQLYVMMGVPLPSDKTAQLLINLPNATRSAHPIILSLGITSMLIAIIWPLMKKIAMIPSTIVILFVTVSLSWYFKVTPQFLISIPSNILSALTFPDFSAVFSGPSLKYIIMFALVGSIESLLTVCAINTMVPQDAQSDLNKDLIAVGIGNLGSALLGGLPMISEIVRSKGNVDYGATSSLSNFFHAAFMLAAVLLFPAVVNLIPLSALAALLVLIGFRLAAPKEFMHVYHTGKDQFLLFLVTMIITVMTDLLIGVASGLAIKTISHMIRCKTLTKLFNSHIEVEENDQTFILHAQGPLTFLNYMQVKNLIEKLKLQGRQIIIDLDSVTFIDHTVLSKLKALSNGTEDVKIVIEENQQLVRYYK